MCSCRWHLDQHTSYIRCLLHPLHSSLSTQSPLCSFKDDPPFHTDLLADRHWWIDRPTLLIGFLLLFFLFFFFLFPPLCSNTQTHKQTQIPAAPVMPVTFLISSELLSMPAVKRFSVSYARHPTNGMSAFFFDTPPVLLLSCMTVLWENIFYVFCFGRCDVWLHYLHHLRFLGFFCFSSSAHLRCLGFVLFLLMLSALHL